MLGGQVTVFGLAVSPWAALGLILLLGLVAGYLVGALLSTRTILQAAAQAKARQEPAYLKGMRSMLARETDQAIAELTRAVELD
jgi:heme exporter protein D